MFKHLDPVYPRVNGNKGTILDVRWYGSNKYPELGLVTTGIVLVWYEADDYLVAYLGVGVSGDPTGDAVNIAEWGNKLEPAAARALWPERTQFKRFKGDSGRHRENLHLLLAAAQSLEEKADSFAMQHDRLGEPGDGFSDLDLHIVRLRKRIETLIVQNVQGEPS